MKRMDINFWSLYYSYFIGRRSGYFFKDSLAKNGWNCYDKYIHGDNCSGQHDMITKIINDYGII